MGLLYHNTASPIALKWFYLHNEQDREESIDSGHGLQNDNAIQKLWIMAVDEYLDKYMPVK
ncbi:MAG: hypothetical protein IJK55_10350 [Bacteroidales bacterium]|nr:hypothetical protein [Bacteroidales bacterium]